jgi:methyl-accepting chemotaxis protein
MKIYGKLLLGISVVISGLVAVIGVLIFQAMSILAMQGFQLKVSALLRSWNDVQLASSGLMFSMDSAAVTGERWRDTVAVFNERLPGLTDDPLAGRLGSTVEEAVRNTKALWDLTYVSLDNAASSFAEFQRDVLPKYPTMNASGGDGLLTEVLRLQMYGQIEALDIFIFSRLKNNLKNVGLSNSSFLSVLERMEAAVEEQVAAQINRTIALGAVLLLLVVLLSLVYTNVFARRISRRAAAIEAAMRRVADRDFTVKVASLGKDEIGQLAVHLGEVVRALGVFFHAVKGAADNVTGLKDALAAGTAESAAAVNQINHNIDSIKTRFMVLDSAIDQATTALNDIGRYLESFKEDSAAQAGSMEKAGAELSKAVDSVSSVARDLAEKARSADKLKRVVLDGGERVQATNEIIRTISRDIAGIAEIIELIDQISEQTNILSMNAAIESAHAGAVGKGFAVVADEIRKLAESTQDNAQRIGDALSAITAKIANALDTSETTARAFDSINSDVVGFVVALEQIAAAAAASSAASIRVVTAINGSVDGSKHFSATTHDMYQRHRAIQDAMQNIQSISDETLAGITEIDTGSQEILDSVVHVNEISAQSSERIGALEEAMAGFRTASDCLDEIEAVDEAADEAAAGRG